MSTPRMHTIIHSPISQQSYAGFSVLNYNRDSKHGTLIAAVWFEGEPEMYSLDNLEAVKALRQYYADKYGEQHLSIIISEIVLW